MEFKDLGSQAVLDAFTGGPIEGVSFVCSTCTSRYSRQSFETLKKENKGCCIACGQKTIAVE